LYHDLQFGNFIEDTCYALQNDAHNFSPCPRNMSDQKIKYFYSSLLSNIIISVVVCFDNHNFTITKQVKGDDPDKKWYLGPPGSGLGVRLTAPPKKNIVTKSQRRRDQGPPGATEPTMMKITSWSAEVVIWMSNWIHVYAS